MKTLYKNTDNGFVAFSTKVIYDNSLSLKEKGLLVTLLGLPQDWNLTVSGLSKITNDGETSIKSALNNLKAKRYITVAQIRTGNGLFSNNAFVVADHVMSNEELYDFGLKEGIITEKFSDNGDSDSGNTVSGKSAHGESTTTNNINNLLKKDLLKNDEVYKDNRFPRGEFKTVLLSDDDINDLYQRLGKEKTDSLIDEMDLYIAQGNQKKSYKNFKAAILNWARNDKRQSQTKKTGSTIFGDNLTF